MTRRKPKLPEFPGTVRLRFKNPHTLVFEVKMEMTKHEEAVRDMVKWAKAEIAKEEGEEDG